MMAKVCQSCGMPLSKDPQGGGTEADGSKSAKFCSLCYANGKFLDDAGTVQEMQALCIDALAIKGVPRIAGWLLTRNLPKLDRWRKTA